MRFKRVTIIIIIIFIMNIKGEWTDFEPSKKKAILGIVNLAYKKLKNGNFNNLFWRLCVKIHVNFK